MFIYLCAFDPKDKYSLNIYTGSFLTEEFDQHAQEIWGVEKFDVIVGNPPYQRNSENGKKTHPIWNEFTNKTIHLLNRKGYLTFIHPSGWRAVEGRFKPLQKSILSKRLLCLEIHNVEDGLRVFGAGTRYDFYTLQNDDNNERKCSVRWQDGTISQENLEGVEFIPNGMMKEIRSLLEKNPENRLNVYHSYTAYESRKKHVARIKNGEFKHPCVQHVNVQNKPSCLFYSNTKGHGGFGTPKIIIGSQISGVFMDEQGDYATCQHCAYIHNNDLQRCFAALTNPKFIRLQENCDVGGNRDRYNRKVLALFRKDFWKEFI